jgi:hypothetical protein
MQFKRNIPQIIKIAVLKNKLETMYIGMETLILIIGTASNKKQRILFTIVI